MAKDSVTSSCVLTIDTHKTDCRVIDNGQDSGKIRIEVSTRGEMECGEIIQKDLERFGVEKDFAYDLAVGFSERVFMRGIIETLFEK